MFSQAGVKGAVRPLKTTKSKGLSHDELDDVFITEDGNLIPKGEGERAAELECIDLDAELAAGRLWRKGESE